MEYKQPTGKVRYVWVLCGGYLIYLGYQLISSLWKGDGASPFLTVPSAVLFITVGALLLRREWKAYQYGKAHMDDPETWSDGEGGALPDEENGGERE